MANTGNTQQNINYGAAANDGLGDPLRTAFIKVDENFDNVWLAGPVGSNITIANNTIQNDSTNGNIILKPNGVGVIQANAAIVPNTANTRDIGSNSLPFRAGYFGVGGLRVDGNVTVTGNLTAGNIIYNGNVFVGDLKGSVYADDSTIMVDAIDNAMFADAATFGNANITGAVTATGNVTGNYFIGNGSQLTGITSYGNSNVALYLNTGLAGNIIPAANLTYSLGNSTRYWSNLWVANNTIYIGGVPLGMTAGNILTVNGNAVLSNNSSTSISTTGNITADTFFGSGVTAAAANDVVALNAFDTDGNTVSIQAQGNTAAAVIETYFEGANNRFTWSFDNSGTLNFPRSQTSIFGGYDNDFTINTSNANVGTVYTFTFSQFGNLVVPVNLDVSGNVYTNDIVGPAAGNVAITANTRSWLFDNNGTLTLPGNSQILPAGNTGVRFSAGASDITGLFLNNAGDAEMYANANVSIYADSEDTAQGWTFDITGNLTLPNNGSIIVDDDGVIGPDGDDMVISWDNEELILRSVEGSVELQADDDVRITTSYGAGDFQWIFGSNNELVNITGNSAIVTEAGNLAISGGRDGLSSGNVTVRAVDVGVAVRDWTFDNAGDLTVPNYIYFKDGSFIGDEGGALPPVFRVDAPLGLGIDLTTDSNISGNNYTWSFGIDGNLTLPVNTFAVNYANGTAVSLGGNYGDANVVTLLGSFGSNSISTTGNVTSGNSKAVTAHRWSTGNATISLSSGSISLNPDTALDATAGIMIGGSGYLLSSNGSRNAVLNYGGGSGTMGIYTVNIYGNQATAITNGGSNGVGNIGANTSNRFNTAFLTAVDASGNVTGGNLNATAGVANIANLFLGNGYVETAASAALNLVPGGAGGTRVWSKLVPNANVSFSLGSTTEYWANGYIGNIIGTTGNFTGNVTGGNLVTGGLISATGTITGDILISSNQNGIEGGEINLSLPAAANTTLSGNIVVIDSYGDQLRFFEDGGTTRGLYIDLVNSPAGVGAAIGYRDIPQVSFTGNTTIATTDAGKHYYSTQSSNYILTIANNASQGFQVGAAISIVNQGTGNITIAQGSGVTLYLAGNSTSGNRTISTFGMATIMKVATDTWFINGTGVA